MEEVIKQFVDMIEENKHLNVTYSIMTQRAEYQALKSLLDDKPKKQTLEEFCIKNTPHGNLDVLTPSEIICLISEYINSMKNNGI